MTSDNNYEVGYGKTPKHTRWQKGQSGNPRGAPKKTNNIDDMFEDEFKRKVSVKDKNGNIQRISQKQALVKRLISSALNGDHKAQKLVMPFLLKSKDIDDFELLPEDIEALEDFKNKIKKDDHE